jgi:magnesium transporter
MTYFSELIGKPVTDCDGNPLGTLQDLVARQVGEMPHPLVEALVVKTGADLIQIPFKQVTVLLAAAIPLKCVRHEIERFIAHEDDIFLARDVLDKQIIDTDGARVVRVNDIQLLRVNGDIYVSNVDVGTYGILRRMGMAFFAKRMAKMVRRQMPENCISWDYVELLRQDSAVRLKVPGVKISELHPADIAEILADMNQSQSGRFLESLDVEQLADALEEIEPDFQATLVEQMPDERVADVLEAMQPDEAADLLAELSPERSEDLLELMEDDEAEEVRRLLTYPEESAGGIMTTSFVTVQAGLNAEQALRLLRENAEEAETIYYVYVVDEAARLVGVFSLSDLVLAQPHTDFMHRRVLSVTPLDSQEKVAQIIAKYDLLAVPVVDTENRIQGIVTSDDALDKIIPTAWKKHLPRFYR